MLFLGNAFRPSVLVDFKTRFLGPKGRGDTRGVQFGVPFHDASFLKKKHFQEWTAEPQISPLRCAPVEMTKEKSVLPGTVVAE
jgi:hypothetical protein